MLAQWISYLPDGQDGYLPYWLAIVRPDSLPAFPISLTGKFLGLSCRRRQQRTGLL